MAYIISKGNVETVSTTTPAHGVGFRFENPCNDDGGHDYSEHICPECGRDFCYNCCGSQNVDQGHKYEEEYMTCPDCGHDIYSEPEEPKEPDDCHTTEPEVGDIIRRIDSRYEGLILIEADNGLFSEEERVCKKIDRFSFYSMAKSSVEANRLEDWDPSTDGPRYWDASKYEAVKAGSVETEPIVRATIHDGEYLAGGSAWDVWLKKMCEVKVVLHNTKGAAKLVDGWINNGPETVLVREEYETTANGWAQRIECPPGHLLIQTSNGSPQSFATFRLFPPDKFSK